MRQRKDLSEFIDHGDGGDKKRKIKTDVTGGIESQR